MRAALLSIRISLYIDPYMSTEEEFLSEFTLVHKNPHTKNGNTITTVIIMIDIAEANRSLKVTHTRF